MLLPSVLGLALCMVCLAATTWAWFTASVTSEANTIQTASFGVSVKVFDSSDAEVNFDNLSKSEYTVTVTPDNGASEGFVIITVTELPESTPAVSYIYHTQQIPSGKMLNFTLDLSSISTSATAFKVDFTPHWGNATYYASTEDIGSPLSGALSDKLALMMLMDDSDELVDAENSDEEDPTDEDAENPEEGEEESDENVDQGENPDDGNGNEEQQPDGSSNPANGENGQQGGEQQGDEPSTPTEGEGEQPDVSGETTGGDISDDTTTGGESPTDTTTPTGGDVPTEPVVTTDPTAQSEGGAPTDPAPTE